MPGRPRSSASRTTVASSRSSTHTRPCGWSSCLTFVERGDLVAGVVDRHRRPGEVERPQRPEIVAVQVQRARLDAIGHTESLCSGAGARQHRGGAVDRDDGRGREPLGEQRGPDTGPAPEVDDAADRVAGRREPVGAARDRLGGEARGQLALDFKGRGDALEVEGSMVSVSGMRPTLAALCANRIPSCQ